MDLSKIIEMATLIIAIVGCCISFYYLGYTSGEERERKNKLLMNKSLLDEISIIQYDIIRLEQLLIRSFLKDRNNKERNEQQ